jgi:dCMP deaminase
MATAFLAAKRSKDPCSQVGACIVNEDKKIVGIGYNGMPTGCNDEEFPWSKENESRLDTKYLYGKKTTSSGLFLLCYFLSFCYKKKMK